MKTYLVGGAVRDQLLGRPIKDHDWVVVGATPTEMLDAGFVQVGAEFPVFLHPNTRDEYALARQERKVAPGYHGFETHYEPDVTLEDDLVRRDLTINAMAMDDDNNLIDPYNGREDLRNRTLRHVSEAFAEDPLRVLRVARFAARYDFTIAEETIELMRALVDAGELDHLTPERVWSELDRALMEDRPIRFFWSLDICGATKVLFPELGRDILFCGSAVVKAALRNADKLTRFMLMFSETKWSKAKSLLMRLKAPSDVIRLVRKFRTVSCLLDVEVNQSGSFGKWSVTAEKILSLFMSLRAYQQPGDLFKISSAVGFLLCSKYQDRMDKLLDCYMKSRYITFAALSDEQQATLKGVQIGEAIERLRLERIQEALE